MRYLVDGLGETAGGDLLLGVAPLFLYNDTAYVDSASGTDAAGYGTPERPCATVGYALNTVLGAGATIEGAIIVLAPTHDETIANTLNFTTVSNRACTIIGVGTTAGRPSAKLRLNAAAGEMFIVNRSGVEFRNIYFPEKVVDNASATIAVQRSCRITGCWFDCGIHDTGTAVSVASTTGPVTFEDTTFLCTAPTCAVRPLNAIVTVAASSTPELYMEGVTFDGGLYNWSGYAMDQSPANVSIQRLFNIALLNGADIYIHANTTGFTHVSQATGGARVVHP